MSKQIVFCADGTWNGPGEAAGTTDIDSAAPQDTAINDEVTNVVKLFVNLRGQVTAESQALHNETEMVCKDAAGNVLQVAKYLHGVGDSKNAAIKVLGGVFGVGVIARIVRGYTFISRYYEPGDSIHITGFSRGAYTARSLAGMIAKVGLLNNKTYDPSDKDQAYRRGFEAWVKAKGMSFEGKGFLTNVLTTVAMLAEGVLGRVSLKPSDFVPLVRIHTVGVWDTVGSLGIPGYVKGGRRDLFSFIDDKLSPMVDNGFHAMALDEMRRDFPVERWDPDPRVEEMWFIGAHSDVGGGYPAAECGLSDIALNWMMLKLQSQGVLLAEPLVHKPNLAPCNQAFHTPWSKPPFDIDATQRKQRADDVFDASVKERWSRDADYQKRWPKLF
ncbi:MAG: DUF2235 domain-containing protein [Gammaproteobacteria bacterium]